MEERYLIDTSAVIKYLNGTLPAHGLTFVDNIVDQESVISLVTEVELRVWDPIDQSDRDVYETFIDGSLILLIDRSIVEETISIRKKHRLKLPDAFIAATAIVHDLTLVADNDKDFLKVRSLKYINPTR